MIVGIVGSRNWEEPARVTAFVFALALDDPDAVVVSGGARTVDRLAERAAVISGLGMVSYRVVQHSVPEPGRFTVAVVADGERAIEIADRRMSIQVPPTGFFAEIAKFRNGWIVEDSERVVAFWDGTSRGTADTIRKTRAAGKPLEVVR